MAVQSIKINVEAGFKPVSIKGAYRLVKNDNQSQALASKIAFESVMERATLNQKYWEKLLEKLRKMGGGGWSDPKFDRITVSMQLMNFLSNKMIQAMIRNFNEEFLKLTNNILNRLQSANQNVFVIGVQKFGKAIFNWSVNILSLIVRRDAINRVSTMATTQISTFVGILSFQLNKLKEILQDELKELIKKLDIKGKVKKMEDAILDFLMEVLLM